MKGQGCRLVGFVCASLSALLSDYEYVFVRDQRLTTQMGGVLSAIVMCLINKNNLKKGEETMSSTEAVHAKAITYALRKRRRWLKIVACRPYYSKTTNEYTHKQARKSHIFIRYIQNNNKVAIHPNASKAKRSKHSPSFRLCSLTFRVFYCNFACELRWDTIREQTL